MGKKRKRICVVCGVEHTNNEKYCYKRSCMQKYLKLKVTAGEAEVIAHSSAKYIPGK